MTRRPTTTPRAWRAGTRSPTACGQAASRASSRPTDEPRRARGAWRETVLKVIRQRLALHEHPEAVADALQRGPAVATVPDARRARRDRGAGDGRRQRRRRRPRAPAGDRRGLRARRSPARGWCSTSPGARRSPGRGASCRSSSPRWRPRRTWREPVSGRRERPNGVPSCSPWLAGQRSMRSPPPPRPPRRADVACASAPRGLCPAWVSLEAPTTD